MTPILFAHQALAATAKTQIKASHHDYTGWYAGLGIGFAIVAVVVVFVAIILTLAARIGEQARTGIERMDEARVTTLPVWEIQKLNASATGIWRAAESAREVLVGMR